MSNNFTTRTASLRATTASVRKLDSKEVSINGENIDSKYASLNASNSFTGNNSFQTGINVLPLGTTTLSGQDAYGLSIAPPSADGTSGGLQLWGVQFATGDNWSDTALKIIHNQVALYATSEIPCSISFDHANVVEFKTMPDDGSATGVTYDFQSWQWTDDSHTSMSNTAPTQILKNDAISLVDKSVLNKKELDENYIIASLDNKYIMEMLNSSRSYTRSFGWIEPDTVTTSWTLKIGDYVSCTITQEDVDAAAAAGIEHPYTKAWVDAINANTTYFRGIYGKSRIYIEAVHEGDIYNVPFGFFWGEEREEGDNQAYYSGETLTSLKPIERLIDYLYYSNFAHTDKANIFTGKNTFKNETEFNDKVNVIKKDIDGNVLSNIIINDGVISFEDTIDGTVIESSGASGYRYLQQVPTVLKNGVCYDIGTISNNTNLSNITFTSENLIQTCEIWFKTSETPPTTHQWPNGTYWIDSATGAAPTLLASKNYRIVFRREPNKIIASIAYLY